jgi:hypothetical protein
MRFPEKVREAMYELSIGYLRGGEA